MTKFNIKTCDVARNRLTKVSKSSNTLRKPFPVQIVVKKAPKCCLSCGFECENSNEEFCADCLEVIYTSFQDKIRYASKRDPTTDSMWNDFDNAMTHVYNDGRPLKPMEIEGPLFISPSVPIYHEMHPYSKHSSLNQYFLKPPKQYKKPVLKVFLKRGPGIYPIVVPMPNASLAIGNRNIDETVKICRVRPWIRPTAVPIPYSHSENQSIEETVKRGRGRPRIHPVKIEEGCASTEVKRGRGRPRIHPIVEEIENVESSDESDSDQQVKRGRGRPRIHPIVLQQNNDTENIDETVRRSRRARPRIHPIVEAIENVESSDESDSDHQVKRGRGRPRIHPIVLQQNNDSENIDETVRRGRGRPRIHPRQ